MGGSSVPYPIGARDACGVSRWFHQLSRSHAGSCRLLNLAGSAKVALGWTEINRAVNFSIRPVSDWAQYGVADFWSAPLATLGAGAGDCEDYAVLKYVALREAGIAPDDLRFLIVYYPRRGPNHVVVAVHLGEEWLILYWTIRP
jgi:predicted transglutaminase-like cysteine proteinase